MDVKKVFSILSQNKENISYSSFFFETKREQVTLYLALFFGAMYFLLIAFGFIGYALTSATLAIIFLFLCSMISFLGSKNFITNPVKFYVESLHEGIDAENNLILQLSSFSDQTLLDSKDILENEHSRLTGKMTFTMGTIDKVGLFPSLLALIYAFQEYQSSSDSALFAYVLLGLIIGSYMGVISIKRIMDWQSNCINTLNRTLIMRGIKT